MHTTLSMGMQATTPPLHPSLSPHTHHCHCPIHRNISYVFFSFFLFVPFLTNVTETLFTPHTGSSKPCLSTHNPHRCALPLPPPKSLLLPFLHLWPPTSSSLFSSSFVSFPTSVAETSIPHMPGAQTT